MPQGVSTIPACRHLPVDLDEAAQVALEFAKKRGDKVDRTHWRSGPRSGLRVAGRERQRVARSDGRPLHHQARLESQVKFAGTELELGEGQIGGTEKFAQQPLFLYNP